MTKNKIALFAIPVLAVILVGGSFTPASAGVDCEGDVAHFIHNSRGGTAFFENTGINVFFAFGLDNCTSNQGPPQKFGFISISELDGCSGFYQIGPRDLVWSLGKAVVKVDTNCGEVMVMLQSNSHVEGQGGINNLAGNCHEGKEFVIDISKSRFADSILLVDGQIIDETLDSESGILFLATIIQTSCKTDGT